jgi:hypothetical protein
MRRKILLPKFLFVVVFSQEYQDVMELKMTLGLTLTPASLSLESIGTDGQGSI